MATIFQRIIDREVPADIVYEDEQSLAFRDINPRAPIHILIIPKIEIPTADDIAPEHEPLIGHLFGVARTVAAQLGLSNGYRLVINCKADAGQEVPHLHVHLLGGRKLTWPPG
jgi:histidine triad (HIT) family protein